ncbi:MAG: aminopeptidase P N-terminal domain-containing protein [Flavobacteriales bacterium]|nr:aminopeptidase P N-terminal domain-containing protein [Flavobacteriales bacterium]
MRYHRIDHRLFVSNRKRFTESLLPQSLAVFNANDIMPGNADGTLKFKQNSDLFHLTGVDQEETILLLAPDARDEEHREVLFLRETNATIAIWEGEKLTVDEARKVTGIQTIYWLRDFDRIFGNLATQSTNIYLNTNEHGRATVSVESRDMRFIKRCKKQFPLHQYHRSAPIMQRLRAVKSKVEVALLQEACDITEKGFRRLLKMVRPGVWEYELEAELIHEFIRNRSQGFAYEPIIASGKNSCVLHYIDNNKQCKKGDILLLDIGAEYANYDADLSRTIPVSGKYSKRQREVYDAVLRVQNAAIGLLRPGTMLKDYHHEVGQLMEAELVRLKLMSKEDILRQDPKHPAYKKYFMHGTSHFLGLDTHDVGDWDQPMADGNVFTCEPGIYIPEEGIGVRIEDDILITQKGPVNLMRNIPKEAEEIEELMNP